jgi:hypothetical protein
MKESYGVVNFNIDAGQFEHIQEQIRQQTGGEVADLSYQQVGAMVVNLLVDTVQASKAGKAELNNRTVVDRTKDGQEAFEGFSSQVAGELWERIETSDEIVLGVYRRPTLWDMIRRREPALKQSFRYFNTPD